MRTVGWKSKDPMHSVEQRGLPSTVSTRAPNLGITSFQFRLHCKEEPLHEGH